MDYGVSIFYGNEEQYASHPRAQSPKLQNTKRLKEAHVTCAFKVA